METVNAISGADCLVCAATETVVAKIISASRLSGLANNGPLFCRFISDWSRPEFSSSASHVTTKNFGQPKPKESAQGKEGKRGTGKRGKERTLFFTSPFYPFPVSPFSLFPC